MRVELLGEEEEVVVDAVRSYGDDGYIEWPVRHEDARRAVCGCVCARHAQQPPWPARAEYSACWWQYSPYSQSAFIQVGTKIKYIIVKIHAYKQLFDTIKLCHVHHYLFTLKRLCIAKLKIIFFRALLSYTNHRLAFCKKKTGPVTYMLLTGPVV